MALIVPLLLTMPAGAIYLEGQAPLDDLGIHILAASSGPAGGNGLPPEVANGDAVVLFHASIAYPAVETMELPKVPALSTGTGSEILPSIASSRYWELPGIVNVGAALPGPA